MQSSLIVLQKNVQNELRDEAVRIARFEAVNAAAAGTLPAGQARHNSIGSVASQWAGTDLAGAVAWVQQLPEGQGKESALQNISKIEDSLWEAADQLRANSKLKSSEYSVPVLGLVFLRGVPTPWLAAVLAVTLAGCADDTSGNDVPVNDDGGADADELTGRARRDPAAIERRARPVGNHVIASSK